MTWKGIVGARFLPNEFADYVSHATLSAWRPQFVVVHNTSSPTVAQRPEGFTIEHMQNLVSFYRDQQGWSAGPHCFVDQNGIWVFTPLTTAGVHSPSWNSIFWGIETLGDYMNERFVDPIHVNLVACLATLHMAVGLDSRSLRFHKEDPRTTHKNCPGLNLDKEKLVNDIHDLIVSRQPVEHADSSNSS